MNLDYENIILISHEDTSRDFTKKTGDKISAIKPNIQDKAANKVAGMVDIVARVVAEDDNRTLSFKNSEVVFGGGRLTVNERAIPLNYDAFLAVYDEANKNAVKQLNNSKPVKVEKPVEEPVQEQVEEVPMMGVEEPEPQTQTEEEPQQTVRTRRRRA